MRRTSYDRMTPHDAGYLTRETAAQPLHYVLQLEVDGRVTYDEVVAAVRPGLDRLPVAHRRIRHPLLTGKPVWVDDEEFTVERQVTAWGDVLTGPDDVDAAFARLTLERLPRDRPLWNLTVAEGPGDATTLWLRVQHAMMDGALFKTLVDELFPAADVERPTQQWQPVRAPSPFRLLVAGVALRLARLVRPTPKELPRPPAEPLPTSMTGPVSASRALADVSVSLAAVKQAARRNGCTINDLFLAVVTDGLRGYLPTVPDVVTALVPRNVRTRTDAGVIGNRAWSMLVPLPTGDPDPASRLSLIRAATESGKQLDSTSGTQGWRFDVALTNVPFGGPHAVAGRPVTGLRATVPLQGENRLVAVLLTHDDALSISFTADGEVYPDVHLLAEATQAAWQRLLATPVEVS